MPNINDIRVKETGVGKLYASDNQVVTENTMAANAVTVYTGPEGPIGPSGPTGPTGGRGISVSNVYISTSNTLVLVLSDESTINAGVLPQGPPGPQGPAGPQGIRGLVGETGQTGLQGLAGSPGPKGDTGPQGTGIDIVGASIDGNYHLILSLSDSTTLDAGLLQRGAPGPTGVGSPGPQGLAGPTGPQGLTGPPGPQGISGIGSQGGQGIPGAVGPPGPIGASGITYETVVSYLSATGTITLDLTSNNFFNIRMTGNITISLGSTPLTTRTYSAVIAIKQTAAGGGTVTWPANCNTSGNIQFAQSTVANATDIYTVFTYDGGVTYILNLIGQAYS